MQKIEIAGLNINPITKPDLLTLIRDRIKAGEQTWVTTLYSEFLYAALGDRKIKEMLNQADISLPDGIGIFWAHKFLSIPLTAKTYLGKILQSLYQAKITLLKLLFSKKDFQTIPGSELIWDLAKMAAKNNFSIYLLGGFGDTPKIVNQKLLETLSDGRQKVFPSLKIAGYSSKNPNDETIIEDIKKAMPDILLVAFGPIKQEEWILKNHNELPTVKLLIGLGGTFDYIAGKRLQPPSIIRKIGLEWLFRLITQPYRAKRIFNATFGLINKLIKYKISLSLPFRKNVAVIIINKNKQILLGLRKAQGTALKEPHWQFPQGGMESGESLEQAGRREALEETGIKSLEFLYSSKNTYEYLWPLGLSKTYKGQKQSIIYFKFIGQENEINLSSHTSTEFLEYKWVPINNLEDEVHAFRKELSKIVLNDLKQMSEKAII